MGVKGQIKVVSEEYLLCHNAACFCLGCHSQTSETSWYGTS